MKIFHAIDSGGFYGAEVMLVNLVAEQMRQGLSPLIASIGDLGISKKNIELEAEKRNLPLKIFRMRPGANPAGARALLQYCRRHGFDIIHSHGYKCNILLAFLPQSLRGSMISTLHGWTSRTLCSRMGMYEALDAISLRFVNRVVVVNKGMLKNPKIARLGNNKVRVVNNGIPISPPVCSEPLHLDILDFCRNKYVIGSIGRYSSEKGFDLLIEAFSAVRNKISNARLLLIGDGGERGRYEKIIHDNNLQAQVMLTGYCPNAWRYLDVMQAYVISSHTEGLPITLLEAMRAGVPVIATKVGGIPDVLEDGLGGVLVHPGCQNELFKALVRLHNDPETAEVLVKHSRKRFKKLYSSQKMCRDYTSLYRDVLYNGKQRDSHRLS